MDSYQQQQHRYMRPPPPPLPQPPSTADPYYHHHQQQQQQQPPPPPRPPVHPQGSWYPNQFQYHPSHSPSPPPPPPPQWAPPPPPQQQQPPHPHSDHFPPPPPGSYPPPPQHHYPAHPSVHQNQFPPPSPPPPRPQVPSSHYPPHPYPQTNQEWRAPNWGHHQAWDYPVAHSNEEDWAAKAKAWAVAKTAMENQLQQSQFTPVGRPEEQNHYPDQYPHSVESHYAEFQHQSIPASNYQQGPVSAAPLHRPPVVHPSEAPSVSSDSSYVPEGHLHTARDGNPASDSNAMFQRQGNLPKSPSVHQQEVPSSYSSVTGNDGGLPFSNSSSQEGQHHMQPPQALPLADQPLEFTPRFNRNDPHVQSSYAYLESVGPVRGMDTVTTIPSMNSWTAPGGSGVGYPPIAPVLPSGPQQHDPALAVPSPVPGHAAPPFSSFPVSGLQPTIPSAAPPFSLGAGTSLHPTTAFPGDAYGIPSVSERPKKASVPNWLKEEIKKAVITSSSLDHPKEETQSIEDEGFDKSVGKGEQADSRSVDSSRSTEEDEDDEDYVEAARTAAINQEIKRVLTEVLLKVTDELFDEIATKVLDEDLGVEVDKDTVTSNHRVSPPPPTLPTGKATAKVLIPGKSKEPEIESVVEKSSSSSPGDVLGLANYATDDEDDEIHSSSLPKSGKKDLLQHSSSEKPSEAKHDVDANGSSFLQPEELNRKQKILESEPSKARSIESKYSDTDTITDFNSDKSRKNESNAGKSTPDDIRVAGKSTPDDISVSRSKDTVGVVRFEPPEDDDNAVKTSKDNNLDKEIRIKPDKNDRHDSKRSSGKDSEKKEESGKRTDEKGNGNYRRHDERHPRKEKTDERNGSKERTKEQSSKLLAQESQSKKRSSHVDAKEDGKETERQHKTGAKEESNRKREHTKDKEGERSRHKHASDSSRHKRRRSSSINRGRSSKDNSVHRDNDSSDEASNDSKRKLHSRRRNLSPSPSPGKSRRRQVSRSPHSKHSQRRHSPYSSLDTNRGRRSRSRTPVRRHR